MAHLNDEKRPLFGGRRSRGVAVAVALLVVAGACTTRDSVPERSAKNGARRGGHLTVGITVPAAIDPSNAHDPMGTLVASSLCEPLVQLDPVTGEPKPALAEAWVVSDTGTRFTVKIRKNARFHDGRKLTATDVAYSLSRLASQDNASSRATLLEPVAGYEEIHGDKETDNDHHREQLQGVRVLSNSSFEVRLKAPNADFMRVLADIATAPVPKKTVEADPDRFLRRPVCAGPYQLAQEWRPGGRELALTRFDGHYRDNKGYTAGGSGYFESITFKVYDDQQALLAAYREGEVDVTTFGADLVASGRSFGVDFEASTRGGIEYVGLPNSRGPFDKPAVRRALSMAIDRRRAIEVGLGGAGQPATGFLPPAVADLYAPDRCGAATPSTADVGGAEALLADTGVSLRGVTVKFYFNDEYGNGALVRAVADQWQAALGLVAEPTPLTWEEYVTGGSASPGFDGPFRLSWRGAYVGPDPYLFPLFHSTTIGQTNFARFNDRAFDRTLERGARETGDATARSLDYRNLEELLCERMPVVPIAFVQGGTLVRKAAVASAIDQFTATPSGLPVLRELFAR